MTNEAKPEPDSQSGETRDSELSQPPANLPQDSTKHRRRNTTNIVTASATAVTAAATIAIAWWTWSYVTYSERQWVALQDTNRIARQQLVAANRAYVLTSGVVGQPIGTPQTGSVRLRVRWENTGNTPTRGLRTYVSSGVMPQRLPKGWGYPDLDKAGKETRSPAAVRGFIAPRGHVISSHTVNVPVGAAQDIGKGGYLYLWGWARYRDTLEPEIEHITKFCYEVTELLIQGATVLLNAAQCDEHNCTDEECDAGRRG